MRSRLVLILLCCAFFSSEVYAQQDSLIRFSYQQVRIGEDEVQLLIKVQLAKGVRLFSAGEAPDTIPHSAVQFDTLAKSHLIGKIEERGEKRTELDPVVNQPVSYFTDSVEWVQRLKLAATDSILVKGTVDYFFKKDDEYTPGSDPFRIFIQKKIAAPATLSSAEDAIGNQSLWWIFLTAFGGGLLALLTPCVYSMIPVTVSFFTKRSKTRAEGIRNALVYATSIIFIFTLLGFLVTLIFGPAALNNLATNWIANLFFFALFVLFGISFLGAFDIRLPSSWTNRSDAKANAGSIWGIFFMALTLALVSFSCTGPIIGNLLVLAARGSFWGPLIGMFGFSMALALPFALFAFFPSKLNLLGKAGGWLNSVKVTLGFLELALALKFLSNADLTKAWRLLDREVFISCWIVIFLLLGLYLLGKLKFHHDDELPKNDFGVPYLSVPRLLFAITSLAFCVYLVPGLWGAPLKAASAFVPPMGTQDFILGANRGVSHSAAADAEGELPTPVKYYERMKIYEPEVVVRNGLTTYFDYNEALAIARKLKKPLMLDFTGITCVNCRKMEGQVWSNPEVMTRLKNDFVIVSLYVDAQKVDLRESDIYFSKTLNKQVTTLGDKNTDLQVEQYGANSQPYYFFIDGNEKRLEPEGYGYDPDVDKFIKLLDRVKKAYANSVL